MANEENIEEEPADAASSPEGLLSQEDIDQLLGMESGVGADGERSGVQAILDSGLVSYERLPMLEIVYDRLVRLMSTSLRNFTSDAVEVSFGGIESIRFGDYISSIPHPAMIGVFKAEEWDNFGLIILDSSLVYSTVDVLLGGRRGTAMMKLEGRPYTTIERQLVENMIKVILTDLASAFDPISSVTMRYDRLETNPNFASIARQDNAAILARMTIDMEDRGGNFDLLFPYATLEPVRELLLQQFMGEKFGRDSIWEGHLAKELWSTNVELDAVLDAVDIDIDDLLKWEKGDFLPLTVSAESLVQLESKGVTLFKGELGQRDGNVAVKVFSRDGENESGS